MSNFQDKKLTRRIASLAGSLLLLAALTSSSNAQSTPKEADAAWTYLAGLGKAERLAVIKTEAAREGTLTLYGALGIDRAQILIEFFKSAYPEVKLEFVRLTTTDLPQRMQIEHRANRVNADVAIVTSDRLNVMSSAIAPYEPTTWADFDPQFLHGGKSQGWAAIDYEVLVEAIGWRSDRIKADDAPKTLDEVAQPKWKGRTGTVTSLEHLLEKYIERYGEKTAMEKMQALAALDNHLYPSIAGLSEALGSGQIDVAWGVSALRVLRLQKSGAPVDFVYQEPAYGNPDAVFAAKGAQHPYAAAAFLEMLTDAKTLEMLDKREPGMTFGNLKGNYARPLSSFQKLGLYPPIPDGKYRELNRVIERLFVRRN